MLYLTIVSGDFCKIIDDNMITDNILSLKKSIHHHFGFPIELIKLTYKDKPLLDNKLLCDYLIQNHDIIHLDLQLFKVLLFRNNELQIDWFVENNITINELQKRITSKVYGIICNYPLEYKIKKNDTIYLC